MEEGEYGHYREIGCREREVKWREEREEERRKRGGREEEERSREKLRESLMDDEGVRMGRGQIVEGKRERERLSNLISVLYLVHKIHITTIEVPILLIHFIFTSESVTKTSTTYSTCWFKTTLEMTKISNQTLK